MKINDVKEMTIVEFFEMCEKGNGEYQIDTPDGWQDINFLVRKKNKKCYNLVMESGIELGCSESHQVFTDSGWKKSKDINVQNDIIITRDGNDKVVAKEDLGIRDTFDLSVNSQEHRYYSNNVVSHNCGKSLISKVIAGVWNMPLLKLDFGKLFGSLVGDSEKNIRSMIRLAESVAPCVLWIDEIEKAISGVNSSGQSDGGTTSRVLSTLLTWMQEKTASVFVVATANNHEGIPSEFLRAGRFDEIFFVSLPNAYEREEIFSVLLRQRKYKSDKFNLGLLSNKSDHYSGAELEKAIDNAMLVGFKDKKRKIVTDDIANELTKFKSLYEMRTEEFVALEEWAEERCLKANAEKGKEYNLGLDGKKILDLE